MHPQHEQMRQERLERLDELVAAGQSGFAKAPAGRWALGALRDLAEQLAPDERDPAGKVFVGAGRVTARRGHGKLAFFDLEDSTGKLQLWCEVSTLGEDAFPLLDAVAVGDIISAEGILMRTKRGEPSLSVSNWSMLTKALDPVSADKVEGLVDTETRYRHRERDLIANPENRVIFQTRARVIDTIRRYLAGEGFTEVETPILQPLYGGASARPFVTHHNALDSDFYLRIASELYLKRCLVGGMDKIFEIGKNFRNEGISPRHNPEFTAVEWYEAYADYEVCAERFQALMAACAKAATGGQGSIIDLPDVRAVDLAEPWLRLDFREAVLTHTGLDLDTHPTARDIAEILDENLAHAPLPEAIDRLFSVRVEPHLSSPTLVFDYPVELCPLARERIDRPGYAERWEAYLGGVEIANSFSELTDPRVQRERFLYQRSQDMQGELDESFISALEAGMPPAGGIGIGIDRLVMLLCGADNLREVILFPTLRPKNEE